MRARGFTLIELVITVAIVGLLATAAFPLAQMASRRAKEQELRLALRDIRDAIDRYKSAVDDGRIVLEVGQTGYPPTLDALAEGVEDAKNPESAMIYFLRRVPRDPFFPDARRRRPRRGGCAATPVRPMTRSLAKMSTTCIRCRRPVSGESPTVTGKSARDSASTASR